ncbi:MAG TPA: hypothetical protein VFJ58_06575 [Armatimonadota bacterium]|nr:hypothetical protein [Armatimonadota bacterium]
MRSSRIGARWLFGVVMVVGLSIASSPITRASADTHSSGAAARSHPASAAANWKQPISLHIDDLPLGRITARLADESGLTLKVEPALRDRKALIDVAGRPLIEVMDRLGAVFGSYWLTHTHGARTWYELKRLGTVRKYEDALSNARSQALREARAKLTQAYRARLHEILAHAQNPGKAPSGQGLTNAPEIEDPDLVHLIGALPEKELDALARFVGEHMPIDPGGGAISFDELLRLKPPIVLTPANLTASQRAAIRHDFTRGTKDGNFTQDPATIRAGITGDGNMVWLDLLSPRASLPGSRLLSSGFTCSVGDGWTLAQWQEKTVLQWMQTHPMPPAAILGATHSPDSTANPAIRISPALAMFPVAARTAPLLRGEFLRWLGKHGERNVIADVVTLSTRITPASPSARLLKKPRASIIPSSEKKATIFSRVAPSGPTTFAARFRGRWPKAGSHSSPRAID